MASEGGHKTLLPIANGMCDRGDGHLGERNGEQDGSHRSLMCWQALHTRSGTTTHNLDGSASQDTCDLAGIHWELDATAVRYSSLFLKPYENY